MRLPSDIISWIGRQCGREIKRSADCDYLALDIESVTGEHIGVNTIKRLLGFIDDERDTRITTLDIIARYLGCTTWEQLQLMEQRRANSSFDGERDEIVVRLLEAGQRVRITYLPDRELVIECAGDGRFEVIQSANSKLHVGDVITFTHIIKGYPLLVSDVLRDGKSLGAFTSGEAQGINYCLM